MARQENEVKKLLMCALEYNCIHGSSGPKGGCCLGCDKRNRCKYVCYNSPERCGCQYTITISKTQVETGGFCQIEWNNGKGSRTLHVLDVT